MAARLWLKGELSPTVHPMSGAPFRRTVDEWIHEVEEKGDPSFGEYTTLRDGTVLDTPEKFIEFLTNYQNELQQERSSGAEL